MLALLRSVVPPHCLITDPRAKKPFETDGLTAIKQMPWLVVLPETVEQVRAVLRVCFENRVALVTRGAGTGLSGGARPAADGVLLGLVEAVAHPRDRSGQSFRARRTGRAQPRDLRGGGAIRPLLRAGPVVADRVQHRRQRRRELGRRALPQVRSHRAQRARTQGADDRRRRTDARRRDARQSRLRPARGVQRFGRHARRRHRGHGAVVADSGRQTTRARGIRDARRPRPTRSVRSSRPGSCRQDSR